MGVFDFGNQAIKFYYMDGATAGNFNRLLRDVLKPGLYAGGTLSIVGLNDIQISPFHVFIRSNDVGLDKAVHIQTLQTVTLTVPNAPNQEYIIYLTYSYLPNLTNYADFNIRTAASPAVQNEIRFGKVINDGAGNLSSITYYNSTTSTYFRDWGIFDVDNQDNLTTSVNPTQDYHVGNRLFNDYRYINHNGPSNWDIQVRKSADGTLPNSRIWFDGTTTQEWELQDRTGTLALHYETFRLGMLTSSLEDITPSADAPWLNISVDHVTLSDSGAGSWPLLVPFLRNLSGGTGYVVTGYTPGVSTILQMDSLDPATEAFVLALYEDNLYHGDGTENYSNYKTLTVSTAFGDIAAGEYDIVDIDPVLYTIEIDANTVGPSAPGTVDHYPFRIKGSSTTARWFRVEDSVLSTGGGNDLPLFRVRDQIQNHKHDDTGHSHSFTVYGLGTLNFNAPGSEWSFNGNGGLNGVNVNAGAAQLTDPTNSTTLGFDPIRYGNITRPRSLVVRKYLYAGEYVP